MKTKLINILLTSKEDIEKADNILANLESSLHGKDGDDISEVRKVLQHLLNSPNAEKLVADAWNDGNINDDWMEIDANKQDYLIKEFEI